MLVRDWKTGFCLAIYLAAIVTSTSYFVAPELWGKYGQFGSPDLLLNWASTQLFLRGENPYHSDSIVSMIAPHGYARTGGQTVWTPPWMLALLAPFYVFNFPLVVPFWLLLNLLVQFYAVNLIIRAFDFSENNIRSQWLFAFAFFPFWSLLQWGHIGMLLMLSVSLFIYAFRRQNEWLQAVALILMLAKPHVLFLLLFVLGFEILRRRRWSLLGKIVFLFAFLNVFVWLRSPEIYTWWLSSIFEPSSKGAANYMSASLVGAARTLLNQLLGYAPIWPMYVLPLVAMTSALFYFSRRNLNAGDVPVLGAVSVMFAPYLWMHDFVVLLPIQICLLGQLAAVEERGAYLKLVSPLVLLNIVCFGASITITPGQQFYFWFPIALLLCCFAGKPNTINGVGSLL